MSYTFEDKFQRYIDDVLEEKSHLFSPPHLKASNNSKETVHEALEGLNVSDAIPTNSLYVTVEELLSDASIKPKKKGGKKKKSSKKKHKKGKKKQKKAERELIFELNQALNERYMETETNPGALISNLMKSKKICIKDGKLYVYNDTSGCFEKCSESDFAIILHSMLDENVVLKLSTREYKEAYKQMLLSHDLIMEKEFFENKPYINCLNGVVDVLSGELLPHSPKYRFKHCIQAKYKPGAECPKFLKFVHHITNGDKELIILLRVILGYFFSHYNNAKKAIIIISIPHTGKSVLCRICEVIVGSKNIGNVDFATICKQEYAASLAGKLLNIAPDLKNEVLKDVGFFKSIVSHDDKFAARGLFKDPESIRGEVKMLFATNHFIKLDRSLEDGDIQAVFNRLEFFPLQNAPISESEDNKHLSEELEEEINGIFTWAIGGLREYIENGENFPKSKLSQMVKNENLAQYCPEKIFVNSCLKKAEDKYESVSDIKESFSNFCSKAKVSGKKCDITRYIEEHIEVIKSRVRINEQGEMVSYGNPVVAYKGLRLKDKARKRYLKEEDYNGEN